MNHFRSKFAFMIACLCLSLLSVRDLSAQAPVGDDKNAKPEPATGFITGVVVLEGGRPADNAIVTLYVASSTAPGVSSPADEEGKFSIAVVAGKLYRIGASYPGYLNVQSPTTSGAHRIGDRVTLTLPKGGVITGRVATESGEPIVALPVSAMMVRRQGQSMPEGSPRNAVTDDRGIYRIFGLQSGGYRVAANLEGAKNRDAVTGFEKDMAVYHPSSSRADAGEVTVEAGREVSGIDIRFRRVRGFSITGLVVTQGESRCGAPIELTEIAGVAPLAITWARPTRDACTFSFDGLAEGEYALLGYLTGNNKPVASEPRIVTVAGADIAGITLELMPLGSISGKVAFEPFTDSTRPAECKVPPPVLPQRTYVNVALTTMGKPPTPRYIRFRSGGDYASDTGEFAFRALGPGNFAIHVRPPELQWYVKSIRITPAPQRTINVGRDGLPIVGGASITGVSIVITEGSGSLMGNLKGDAANADTRWRLFLVPADRAVVDDGFRYRLLKIDSVARFYGYGVAPGQYWLVPRLRLANDNSDDAANPAIWSAAERAKLLKEGAAAGNLVEVKPCQHREGYSIVLPQR